MSGEVMVRHCSPTLAGLKTGSMFSYPFANNSDLYDSVRYWNRLFTGKGLRVLPLCHRDGRALIYVFRPQKLCQDLRTALPVNCYAVAVTATRSLKNVFFTS